MDLLANSIPIEDAEEVPPLQVRLSRDEAIQVLRGGKRIIRCLANCHKHNLGICLKYRPFNGVWYKKDGQHVWTKSQFDIAQVCDNMSDAQNVRPESEWDSWDQFDTWADP